MRADTGSGFRLEAGRALFGDRAMTAFTGGGVGILGSATPADDLLKCAVQSGIGTLRVALPPGEERWTFPAHLKTLTSSGTRLESVSPGPEYLERLVAGKLTGLAMDAPPDLEDALASVCGRNETPFVSVRHRGWGVVMRYLPPGTAYHSRHDAIDRILAHLAPGDLPRGLETVVHMAAGIHAWYYVQAAFCMPDTLPRFFLLDLQHMRWCRDDALLEPATERRFRDIPWQTCRTTMP